MNHRARFVSGRGMNDRPRGKTWGGVDYGTAIKSVESIAATAGKIVAGTGVGDAHRAPKQLHELQIQRCDDEVDRRRSRSHNRAEANRAHAESKNPRACEITEKPLEMQPIAR